VVVVVATILGWFDTAWGVAGVWHFSSVVLTQEGVEEGMAMLLLRNEGGGEEKGVWVALACMPHRVVVRGEGEGEGQEQLPTTKGSPLRWGRFSSSEGWEVVKRGSYYLPERAK
jgi:hypothetical protein